jgi:hypothetical protein
MNSLKFNDWIQLLGIAGLIASLVFVGLELKLSRELAAADAYQQRTALSIEVQLSDLEVFDRLAPIYAKIDTDEPLSQKEKRYYISTTLPWLTYWENSHFQHQMGLLSDEQWLSSRNSLRDVVQLPVFREWWTVQRNAWRESFAQEVDRLIAEASADPRRKE